MAGAAAIIPIFSAVGSLVSSFASAGASSQAGAQQAAAAQYNAQVARNNAIAAQQAAEQNAKQQEKINAQRLAQLHTNLLHSGVTLEGTPLMLLDETAVQGALEAAKERYKGKIQAANYMSEAGMQDMAGQQALATASTRSNAAITSGLFTAGGTLGSSLFKNTSTSYS